MSDYVLLTSALEENCEVLLRKKDFRFARVDKNGNSVISLKNGCTQTVRERLPEIEALLNGESVSRGNPAIGLDDLLGHALAAVDQREGKGFGLSVMYAPNRLDWNWDITLSSFSHPIQIWDGREFTIREAIAAVKLASTGAKL